MISKISESITNKLLVKYNIDNNDFDIYTYGVFMFISFLYYVILSCILGIVFNCLFESLLFSLSFQLVRKYAGGYHAKTEKFCLILTSSSCVMSTVMIKLFQITGIGTLVFILTLGFVIFSCVMVPIDTPENPLAEVEVMHYRKISIIIILVLFLIVICSFLLQIEKIFAPCCISLILEGILLVAGKIQKIRVGNTGNS